MEPFPTTSPSIQVATHTDLSLLYRCLRILIRPLRPHLVKPGKPQPSGSPKLKRPKSKCTIEEGISQNIYLYHLHARDQHPASALSPSPVETGSYVSGEPKSISQKHQVFYFSGGGFQSLPSSEHWKTCANLAISLADSHQVTLVSYPLAPNSPAAESLPALRTWLEAEIRTASTKGRKVSLVGDSSGGNITLSLGIWWAEQLQMYSSHGNGKLAEEPEMKNGPRAGSGSENNTLMNILAISPATDLRNTNPEIMDADKRDPVLTVKMTSEVGKIWAGSLSTSDPSVSPNLASSSAWTALRESGIKVHGVVGTHDVLAPDAIAFQNLCNKNGIVGEWLVWEGQMHCFPLAGVYGMKEGKEGINWILDVLRRNV